jgi:hypothetical protein
MIKLIREYQLFSDNYKDVVFTLLTASRYRKGNFPKMPKNVLALILMVYPDYSYRIDSGFILIVDPEGFSGWNLSNLIMNEYPTHGWKFAKYSRLGPEEQKAVIDTYVKAEEPTRRAIAVHNKKGIFTSSAIRKYCLDEAHFNAMTFIYVGDSARDVPRRHREDIQKLYSPLSANTLAKQMSMDESRVRKIRTFMVDRRVRFYEYHIFGQ